MRSSITPKKPRRGMRDGPLIGGIVLIERALTKCSKSMEDGKP